MVLGCCSGSAEMAAAVALPVPAGRKVKPVLLTHFGHTPATPLTQVDEHTKAEEFDFAEVFGPVPVPPEGAGTSHWLLGDPEVIYSRSHSLVGPSPRLSLVRQHSKRGGEEHEVERAERKSLVSRSFQNVDPDSGSNQDSVTDAEFFHDARGLLSDSGSDIGEEQECAGSAGDVKQPPSADERLGPQDFERLRVVGQGAFGKVFQVQKKRTTEIYAMKVMRKDKIMERNHGDYMKAERDILTKIVHPFIVQLRYSFQTKSKLYLLLDFINGGHLFFQLYRQGIFSEERTRMYTAEIVCAVSHLHSKGIIHRDLKPENILLDAEGHVKLTDFGLAKEVDDSNCSNSLCGTVEYMAPEMVRADGHGRAADWWSVGILVYEMLTGRPPFCHGNRQVLQQKILKDKIKLPSYLTSDAHKLLKALLDKDPSRRLGSGSSGSDDIKQHRWFKGINWTKLEARELTPKFRPDVKGIECTANFDERWTKLPTDDSPASTPKHGDCDFFQGYTYVAPPVWLSSDVTCATPDPLVP